MGEVVEILPTDRVWADRINAALAKSVEGIIEAGQHLIDAKAALPHGGFEIMVRDQLPFGTSAARKLMSIASNAALAERSNWNELPASWTSLYELSKWQPRELDVGLQMKAIRPETRAADIPEAHRRARKQLGERVRSPRVVVPEPRPLTFWAECRKRLEADPDQMEPAKREHLLDRVVQLIAKEMADG